MSSDDEFEEEDMEWNRYGSDAEAAYAAEEAQYESSDDETDQIYEDILDAAKRRDLKELKKLLADPRSARMKYVSGTTMTRESTVKRIFLECHDVKRKAGHEK